jgi:hypothetical protein
MKNIAQDEERNEARKSASLLSLRLDGEHLTMLMRLIFIVVMAHSQLG